MQETKCEKCQDCKHLGVVVEYLIYGHKCEKGVTQDKNNDAVYLSFGCILFERKGRE